jgi:hypothetical protein
MVQPVVPVRGDYQHRRRADAAREKPHQVERRLVRPVNVLDHDHVEPVIAGDLAQQRAEQLVALGPVPAQILQRTAEIAGEVEQRGERPRRRESVAGAPRPAGTGQIALEPLDQHRLSCARLTGDQDKPSFTPICFVRVLA